MDDKSVVEPSQAPAAAPQQQAPAAQRAGGTLWRAVGCVAGSLVVVMLFLALAGLTTWWLTRNRAPISVGEANAFIQTPVGGSRLPTDQLAAADATATSTTQPTATTTPTSLPSPPAAAAVPATETPVPPAPTVTPAPTETSTPAAGQPVVEFSADKTSINAGESVLLQWRLERVQAAYLSGGEFINGIDVTRLLNSFEVYPQGATTYILHADTVAGAIERSVTITVQGALDRQIELDHDWGRVRIDGRVNQDKTSVGDDENNLARRGFFIFDMAPVSGGEITEAWLELDNAARIKYGVDGDPFATLGQLYVEDVDCSPTLTAEDYDRKAAATLAIIDDEEGLFDFSVDIAQRLSARLDEGQRYFCVRLRFANATDNDNHEDRLNWESVDLLVHYRK